MPLLKQTHILREKGFFPTANTDRDCLCANCCVQESYPMLFNRVAKVRIGESLTQNGRCDFGNTKLSGNNRNHTRRQVEMVDDTSELKSRYEEARQKFKPESVQYLLIAEAPPDSVERFFYCESVRNHDHLFLGVAQTLYPGDKEKFLESGRSSDIKRSILLKLKEDGFYLLDLSELPLSRNPDGLCSQLPSLVERIERIADKATKIILIKASVYDLAFDYLRQQGFENVVDVRIPFPASGQQGRFQKKFRKALLDAHQ